MQQGRAAYAVAKKPFPAPGAATRTTIEQHVVSLLVQHAEQRSAGPSLGVKVTAAQVDAAFAQLVKSQFGGSRAKLDAALRRQGLTVADLRDSERSSLLQAAIANKVEAGVKVSSAEIEAYYDAHRSQYKTGRTRVVRAAGKTFMVADGMLPTADANLVFALPVGRSTPRKVSYGSGKIVMKAVGPTNPPQPIPLSRVRVPIAQLLILQKREAAVKGWMNGVAGRCAKRARYATGFKPS
jgi:hypothetical protein